MSFLSRLVCHGNMRSSEEREKQVVLLKDRGD